MKSILTVINSPSLPKIKSFQTSFAMHHGDKRRIKCFIILYKECSPHPISKCTDSLTDTRRQFKVNTALKPDKLLNKNTPEDFRIWIAKLSSYYETSCMEEVSITSQEAYFKQCLYKNLCFILK